MMGLIQMLLVSCHSGIDNFKEVQRLPSIFPDYTGIVIPPNIAPLNFLINEPGSEYEARIYTDKEKPLVVRSSNPSIRMNLGGWHQLLQQGTGAKLFAEMYL